MNKTEREAVLKDPNGHFPYKREAALDAGLPEDLVAAAEAVVKAQQAYLEDPSSENLAARNEAEREAQRVSAEMRPQREAFALRQRLKDLEAGNEPANISLEGQVQ